MMDFFRAVFCKAFHWNSWMWPDAEGFMTCRRCHRRTRIKWHEPVGRRGWRAILFWKREALAK